MKFNFSKEWCLQAAQTEAGIAVAACNPNIFKENQMKTAFIRHYESKEDFDRYCTKKDLMESHLVSYSFEGDYVYVVKSRFSGNFMTLNIPRYLELVACTLKHKSYDVEEKKSINDFVRNIWNSRLEKLEVDLFPAGYIDCLGGCEFRAFPVRERLSRIENRMGIDKESGCDLDRLEKCEFSLDHLKLRVNNLEVSVFPTSQDILEQMRPVTTFECQIKRLEEKLGGDLAFTNVTHRIANIEKHIKMIAPNILNILKDTPYVCPILKHQQALQDALQDAFNKKEYAPKYKVGDTLIFAPEKGIPTRRVAKITTYPSISKVDVYEKHYIFEDKLVASCELVDNNQSIYLSKTYVPKYHIGDVLEFNYEHGREIKNISKVGVFYKCQPNIPFYCFEDGSARDCEAVDKDNCSVYKVTPKPKWTVGSMFWLRGRVWKVFGIDSLRNKYILVPDKDCGILDWRVSIDEVDNGKEISPPIPEFDC